jgi:hypothetical protein
VKRALKSDHSADDEGARDPADDYEIVVTHERIFQLSKLTVSKCYNQTERRPLSSSIARGLQLLGGAFRRSAASPAMLI